MQAEGLNLEAIRRVLESTDGSSQEIVDFARAVRAPFEDETPEIFEPEELAAAWKVDRVDPKLIRQSEKLGMLRELPDGKIEVISPRLHRAGLALIELGVSPEAALATAAEAARARRGRLARLHRPLHPGDLGALRQGRPARGGLAEDPRGARPDAAARLRRAAGDVPDHDGRGDREGGRTDAAGSRPATRAPARRSRNGPGVGAGAAEAAAQRTIANRLRTGLETFSEGRWRAGRLRSGPASP